MSWLRSVSIATLALCSLASVARAETVELIPNERAGWSLTNVFAPVTGLFLGGPGYWYRSRRIEVETTPPGAVLDLFYVRAGFQKAYEQAEAPVTIVLPSRIEAGARDSVTIRALLDGYRQAQVQVRVRSRETHVTIDLGPLPNLLTALSHTYFAGRGSLTFLTKVAPTFRLQKSDDGFSVVLQETAASAQARESLDGLGSSLVSSVQARQLGEDLVVGIELADGARDGRIEVRSRQSYDPVRGLHGYSLDLIPPDRGARAVERARAALARIGPSDVRGCPISFEEALRDRIGTEVLARSLTPKGSFTDPYLRAALKRLGEVSPGGVIEMHDGTRFHASVPIELSAAASQAADARGYLALLRRFVFELEPPEHRRETLRGLLAPETPPSSFEGAYEAARIREQRCLEPS